MEILNLLYRYDTKLQSISLLDIESSLAMAIKQKKSISVYFKVNIKK